MNKYIVGMATQGFANYILKAFPGEENLSVVVGHDCRNNSRLFAETVAAIFSANGIKAYLFESLRPTPEISFAIRELGAKAGVNVTASHPRRPFFPVGQYARRQLALRAGVFLVLPWLA